MLNFLRSGLTAALLTLAFSAHATVLDFDAQSPGSNFGTITEGGFDITGSGSGQHYVASGPSFCGPPCPDNGTQFLLLQNDFITISSSTGDDFDLVDFDGAEAHADREVLWAESIEVIGTLAAGGTVTATFVLDGVQDGPGSSVDFQQFSLPGTFVGLSQVVFRGIGSNTNDWFTMDNVTVQTSSAAVPTPATMGLVMMGLLGARLRKSAC